MANYLVAKEPFAFTGKDGVPRLFTAGQAIDASDPDLKGREHLFEDPGAKLLRAASSGAAETASASPGERRTRTRTKSDDEKDAE